MELDKQPVFEIITKQGCLNNGLSVKMIFLEFTIFSMSSHPVVFFRASSDDNVTGTAG